MQFISQIIFAIIFFTGIWFFIHNIKKLFRNIKLGIKNSHEIDKNIAIKNMIKLALGQGKMTVKPIAGILHIIVYIGFLIINIEVFEIILDGMFGTHRIFKFFGNFYNVLISSFEVLAILVVLAVIIFWVRRNLFSISRFKSKEMTGFPKWDADNILFIEFVLMICFLVMNGADLVLQDRGVYPMAGSFPISEQIISPLLSELPKQYLLIIERIAWWIHIVGIIFFLNYLYYSKHLHIILAFPNTYFAKQTNKGYLMNLDYVTSEVNLLLGKIDEDQIDNENNVQRFGAKDIFDLERIQLLNAYTCTECGRCTAECPASHTGKKLSPRKIMMSVRDRLEEVSVNIDKNKTFQNDGKTLVKDYISPEELWACTSCNACVEACPISINPLSIIMDLRRYLVLEESAAPSELNIMMNNIENNGAPWAFNQQDRGNWVNE